MIRLRGVDLQRIERLLLLLLLLLSFVISMQGIYNKIPETNQVYTVNSVAAIL
jgi:hypothetical protein